MTPATTFTHSGVTQIARTGLRWLDIPAEPDFARLRRDVSARLHTAMSEQGVDALVLLGNSNVMYATGISWPLADAGLSHVERPVAVVLADDEHPHLYLPFREGAAMESGVPDDHLHGPVYLEFDEGVEQFGKILAGLVRAGATIAVDELTGAMRRAGTALFPQAPVDAAATIGAAKIVKTVDQISALRRATQITEQAVADIQKSVAPGVRQIDLSAEFVRRSFELGATTNMFDSIWQVMPASRADGTWTTHGDLALPLLTTERELRHGDVLWTDVSIAYHGYCSDHGRTWIVGQDPTPAQQRQFDRWREIVDAVLSVTKAGATCGDLGRAATKAAGGQKPWLPHFYLGHGIGTSAAEMPMIGTDLGQEWDDNFVFPDGMLLVFEPVVWEDGTGGYRGEEIVVVTEGGWMPLTAYPYDPYEVSSGN
ncbi:Xaa-Pro peptidase family protein [Mycolicibacterium smegmatis]|uniref:M24 family metallopeptidase n=1 Tax=Mycolicibacterium smegmatis TaxID=1772 RepID=UPI0005D85CC8|nr:Xaa-Pro peptidase family protein [Mycolicibacterium smegmatis]MDF1897625.1 Xaa-Pro peptidase family protein [Mycolicibacterium smegmatis]MDF1903932.1 Xaa-Pro peptidase family protein [Mycolicibacterium smegmatis]MDF1917191.1 Xaa-Pro peptidase family protein [Mycolicibacterium smegmatis]MDF1922565.1 Xaa-Pro peptidase family protein [Mycolicibacterium smegmatis]UAK56439.1 Xaa-Pro peptidase family protein [Mycolicibacterium smegmatis]